MLMVEPLVEIETAPVALRLLVAGPRIEIVAADPAAPVLCDTEIGPDPTKTTFPVETVPVDPAVLPKVETPALTPPPPPPAAEAVIVLPLSPNLTPLDFPKTRLPSHALLVPPLLERLAKFVVATAERTT